MYHHKGSSSSSKGKGGNANAVANPNDVQILDSVELSGAEDAGGSDEVLKSKPKATYAAGQPAPRTTTGKGGLNYSSTGNAKIEDNTGKGALEPVQARESKDDVGGAAPESPANGGTGAEDKKPKKEKKKKEKQKKQGSPKQEVDVDINMMD